MMVVGQCDRLTHATSRSDVVGGTGGLDANGRAMGREASAREVAKQDLTPSYRSAGRLGASGDLRLVVERGPQQSHEAILAWGLRVA